MLWVLLQEPVCRICHIYESLCETESDQVNGVKRNKAVNGAQHSLLQKWVNFNPSMDK